MAEIHVEAKKNATPAWIWILIVFIVAGIIAYFVLSNKKANETNTRPNTTSYIQPVSTNNLLVNG